MASDNCFLNSWLKKMVIFFFENVHHLQKEQIATILQGPLAITFLAVHRALSLYLALKKII
jgi:hypothetical protein